MLKPYRTIDDVLRSPWAAAEQHGEQPSTDRVLRSTKLEDSIYADLRDGDDGLEQAEGEAAKSCPPSRRCPGTVSYTHLTLPTTERV